MIRQRLSGAADAEMRAVYSQVLVALQTSRYGDRFAEFRVVPSPDGLGEVLAC
jgi:hypothetical protein